MDFLRRFLFELGCAVVAIAGIVAAAVAYGGYDDIAKQMAQAESLMRKLDDAAKKPRNQIANPDALTKVADYNVKIDAQSAEVDQTVRQLNARAPLRDDVFPSHQPGDPAPYLFRADYRKKFTELAGIMRAEGPPTDDDIEAMRVLIAQETRPADEDLLGLEGLGSSSRRRSSGPTRSEVMVKPKDDYGSGGAQMGSRGRSTGGPLSAEELEDYARTNANVRAAITKAKQIWMYASLDAGSFDVVDSVYQDGDQPASDAMWDAQLKLWVQEDVAKGLLEANQKRADTLDAQNELEPDVSKHLAKDATTLPVKRLIVMGVSPYVQGTGVGGRSAPSKSMGSMGMDAMKSGRGGGISRGGSAASGLENAMTFTGSTSNADYDVVRFRIQLVVDSRYLLEVINAICRQNFFIPLNVTYTTADADPSMSEYVYGPDPVIDVTIDFEGYFFRDIYEPMMPDGVKELLGITSGGPARQGGKG